MYLLDWKNNLNIELIILLKNKPIAKYLQGLMTGIVYIQKHSM